MSNAIAGGLCAVVLALIVSLPSASNQRQQVSGATTLPDAPLSKEEWAQASEAARLFVARESPDARFPFETSRPGRSDRKVFADYMPSIPISFDNEPPDSDNFSRRLPTGSESDEVLLRRFGVWQRPLPTRVWQSRTAFATNAAIDVERAARIGIDGFLLDLISLRGRYWDWAKLLFDAAAATAPGFRIAVEPDMNALKGITLDDLADALSFFYKHPASYHLPDGRLLVVPFRPDNRTPSFWHALSDEMNRRGEPIALIPETLAINQVKAFAPGSAGLTFWGGRSRSSGPAQLAEARYLTAKTGLPVMMPVAPQDFRPKSAIVWEAGNTGAFRSQWQAAIESNTPWVHLITWNDYSEGTEVAPSSTTQFLIYDLAAYYIYWFKNGAPPKITRDALFYDFRSQIFDPKNTKNGQSYQLLGADPLTNNIELIGFLRQPGSLQIALNGGTRVERVDAGLQTLTIPAQPGRPCFRMLRNGKAVVTLAAATEISAAPRFKDGLYGGGSSLRPYVKVFASRTGRAPVPAQNMATQACRFE